MRKKSSTMYAKRFKLTQSTWAMTLLTIGLVTMISLMAVVNYPNSAQESPLHPTFPLLDENGDHVLDSGHPVSTMKTCGTCHDTEFIAEHSFHTDIGLNSYATETGGSYPWDTSPGYFGRWDPITYRYLSPEGDEIIDMTTAEWMQTRGARHVGGGPSVYSRQGLSLTELPIESNSPETSIIDPDTGELVAWDWLESGVVEMNCFLCHIPNPDNDARINMLQSGAFQWANTATLFGSGMVDKVDDQWHWNSDVFDENGDLVEEFVIFQDPTSENCSQCHGLAHVDPRTPLILNECEPAQWSTITTGQIFSPQRIADSGANFRDKESLSRSWDVHAESVLDCTDCHYSLNNPVYFRESEATRPEHLTFDPRRIDLGEYLYRPLHQFAKGENMQSNLAPELDNTLRRCESCHTMEAGHDWLPYREAHAEALDCESCHIPQVFGPARQYNDWTVLTSEGAPQTACRGLDSEGGTFGTALITGFEPVLLPRENNDVIALAPYNLITSWYWVYGDPVRPVPYRELLAAWFEDGVYHPDILDEFDINNDGQLDYDELVIDTEGKASLIATRLEAQGLDNPRIKGSVQPYGINHNVAYGEWAVRECDTCHSNDSRITTPMVLADRLPGGVMPTFVSNSTIDLDTGLHVGDDGILSFQPQISSEPVNIYIFGLSSVSWVDWLGVLMFLGTLGMVTLHGGMRFRASRRNLPEDPELRRVYMYSLYERQWHWLQTVVILGLIFTGLIIHKPGMFGLFSFRYVVEIHNILAAILVINAALAAFYHLASGEIRQYLPQPRGFFNQAIEQTKYYVWGIFRGDPHPVEKTRDRKLNPLQQVTYFAILNILLPLQVITGALIWGAQQWPETADSLGGLPFLAPFHTLIAWSFASFVVAHVYLTTTAGHTPSAGIKAMIMGWDDIEIHQKQEEIVKKEEVSS